MKFILVLWLLIRFMFFFIYNLFKFQLFYKILDEKDKCYFLIYYECFDLFCGCDNLIVYSFFILVWEIFYLFLLDDCCLSEMNFGLDCVFIWFNVEVRIIFGFYSLKLEI